jgi:acetylglutamate kinase
MVSNSTEHPEASLKAATLTEALPWIRRFQGCVFVVKLGGNAMVDDELLQAFADDMVFLHTVGGGYRVTSTDAIPVVRDVLRNQIGADIARRINQHHDMAVVLSGEDHGLFRAARKNTTIGGVETDLGHVGEVVGVNPSEIHRLLGEGFIPVVSSLAPSEDGSSLLNVNADAAAAALASALRAEKLVLLTDVAGLYENWPATESLISTITTAELEKLLPRLESGMIPKMTACLDAVTSGVSKAAIIDGRLAHSILLEAFTIHGIGTEVVSP